MLSLGFYIFISNYHLSVCILSGDYNKQVSFFFNFMYLTNKSIITQIMLCFKILLIYIRNFFILFIYFMSHHANTSNFIFRLCHSKRSSIHALLAHILLLFYHIINIFILIILWAFVAYLLTNRLFKAIITRIYK